MADRQARRLTAGRQTALRFLATAFAAAAFAGINDASAVDTIELGQALYENHCAECHKTIAHTRESRIVRNRGQLEQQVDRWQSNLNLRWSAEDNAAVAQYLNQRFYKF